MSEGKMLIEELVKQPSILASIVDSPAELESAGNSSKLQLEFARQLEALETEASKSRAAFILNQDAKNFNANREVWGIPNFLEGLVTIDDFKNGFL